MKALQATQTGGAEVMKLVELPDPEPGEGKVRIKMEAAGVNYSDISIRRGSYPGKIEMPMVMGREYCGTVEKLGPGASTWKTGQRVVGTLMQGGAFAEYIVAPEKVLTPIPKGLSPEQAVVVPIQGTTAVHLVDDMARVKEGDTVLIHAAAGGVGLLALQICRLRGARVLGTTSSDEKCEILRGYGVTPINYTKGDWVAEVMKETGGKGADVILESIGGDVFLRSFREALATFGRCVVYGNASGQPAEIGHREPMLGNKTLTGYFLSLYFPEHLDLVAAAVDKLLGWFADGSVKIVIGHSYPLAQGAEAIAIMENRKNVGKVVITA